VYLFKYFRDNRDSLLQAAKDIPNGSSLLENTVASLNAECDAFIQSVIDIFEFAPDF
jgi:hypothetical protein